VPLRAAALAVGALCALGVAASTAGAATSVTVVARGLDNPRGLTFTPNGNLYVAEAGHGGSECLPPGPGLGGSCIGFTSGISQITASGVRRVVTGLVSDANPDGTFATGIDGISAQGGRLFGIETASSDFLPASPNPFLSPATISMAGAQLGHLIEAQPSGRWKATADVGHTDFVWSGDNANLVPGQFPDANPYAVLAEPGVEWVIDAASNTLDEVRANGTVTVVAFFPNPPVPDAVPTCIDRGPDGALYVGELTGAGNAPGSSIVWRVVPGQAPVAWATGLTAVTGCGFGADGQFYAVEFSTLGLINAAPSTGAVVRVAPGSTSPDVIAGDLSFPGGFAAGADGSLYVSNWSIAPAVNSPFGATGEVDRILP
jgi:hypothetical protein